MKTIYFAAGCFWGVEETFHQTKGVVETSVGYMGGTVENPSYQQVCTGKTQHAEVVRVDYDPNQVSLEDLLELFWRAHDPTQVGGQGVDRGTQYRSAIFCRPEELAQVTASREQAQTKFTAPITTEIKSDSPVFYPAEDYHQKYYLKNGPCSL
jgi:peptide-methionine (S)-S-oxide reductase